MWQTKETVISEIKQLLDSGYDIEVESPDGWVGVNSFIDKGMWQEYILKTENGFKVICNENHLFKTMSGWMTAAEMLNLQEIEQRFLSVNTSSGISPAIVYKTDRRVPIVDINVNHENHRYYTNGVESHNTGVGKSLAMCHIAAACLAAGLDVLYITNEMAEEKIAERIDANLLNVSISQLKDLPKQTFTSRIGKLLNKTHGKLVIKEYPTSSAHAGHFNALMTELYLKKNFKPRIVFIDYLNICASVRFKPGNAVNSYTYVKAIAEELRGFAVEHNVPVVTATQTTRSGFSNTDIELTDTSESFGLPATADLMLALISTEELEQLNQIMVKQLKNRYCGIDKYKRFMLGIDKPKMRLYNLEISAQENLTDSGIDIGRDIDSDTSLRKPFSNRRI